MVRFELLAPAGSITALKAAVNAGADAVYIGGNMFGARAYADNPEQDELIEGIEYCHLRGRKCYLTVNTLLKETELRNVLQEYLWPYYSNGIDAVIVQDAGAMKLISEAFPDLPIHISTQAAITMAEGAQSLKDKFFSINRVVPARELSLSELERFRKNTDLEMEVFVHGALCYSCSGQCLMSSVIGGRSGNRGRCAQPCRKLYDGKCLLSPKDQCLLPVLHELMDIGIDSFKIEGRMKSPEYTAGVVSVYRKYIDMYVSIGSEKYRKWLQNNGRQLEKDISFLQELYNRGGFNEGYLHKHNGPEMMCFDRPNHSGVKVGTVIAVRGRESVISFEKQVMAHDVLEIRGDKGRVFEFTLGSGFDKGETFSCITMKGNNAEKGMGVYRTRCEELLRELDNRYIENAVKVPVRMLLKTKIGMPMTLEISADYGISGNGNRDNITKENVPEVFKVTVTGQQTEQSISSRADEAQIRKQLGKLGETDFVAEEITIDTDADAFVPSGALNALRRAATAELRGNIISRYHRQNSGYSGNMCVGNEIKEKNEFESDIATSEENAFNAVNKGNIVRACSVWNMEQLKTVRDFDFESICYNISSYDDAVIDEACSLITDEKRLDIGLPYVSRADIYDRIKEFAEKVREKHPGVGFLARTTEECELLSKLNISYRTDYNLYVMNSLSSERFKESGGYTLPLELNKDELKAVAGSNSEMIVYGFQPVMFSAQCVYKNKFGMCRDRQGSDFVSVTDELGHDFRARQLCAFCTNVIYNSSRYDITDRLEDVRGLGCGRIRYDFTFETEEEIRALMEGKHNYAHEHCTGGHFLRGIQ